MNMRYFLRWWGMSSESTAFLSTTGVIVSLIFSLLSCCRLETGLGSLCNRWYSSKTLFRLTVFFESVFLQTNPFLINCLANFILDFEWKSTIFVAYFSNLVSGVSPLLFRELICAPHLTKVSILFSLQRQQAICSGVSPWMTSNWLTSQPNSKRGGMTSAAWAAATCMGCLPLAPKLRGSAPREINHLTKSTYKEQEGDLSITWGGIVTFFGKHTGIHITIRTEDVTIQIGDITYSL